LDRSILALAIAGYLVGFVVLGTVTGIGGGTLPDVLLGSPVFWAHEPATRLACTLVSVLVFFAAHAPRSRYRYLLGLDATGLALFAVTGAEKDLNVGTGPPL